MSASPAAEAPPLLARRPRFRMQELGLLVVILLLYLALTAAGFAYRTPNSFNAFLNLDNQFNGIGTSMSIYAIMAVGMTAVVITGGIDISVGAIFGFAALAAASVLQHLPADSPWYIALPVAFAVPTLVGGLLGLLNGALIVGLRMHPFIVTLGTLSIIRGLCVLWFPSTVPTADLQLPNAFVNVMAYNFGAHLRLVPVIVMLIVGLFGALYLHALVAGRETYAIGGNIEAARFSGIRVGCATLRVYVLMGLCAGVAAVVHLGRFNSTSTNDGSGYELLVIASAVVGGASLTGGRGTALGALLGTLIISLIDNGILILHWRTENTKVIVGASIIIAVAIDRFSDYLVRRRTKRTH